MRRATTATRTCWLTSLTERWLSHIAGRPLPYRRGLRERSSPVTTRHARARQIRKGMVVLPEGIELSTSPLPRECSTTELRQQVSDISCFPAPEGPEGG